MYNALIYHNDDMRVNMLQRLDLEVFHLIDFLVRLLSKTIL